jgi:hypothetical protein
MARFTNIGLPRKTFVASAAEEAERVDKDDAPAPAPAKGADGSSSGKRKGWGRDPEIASESFCPAYVQDC